MPPRKTTTIFYNFLRGQCIDGLNSTFGDEKPSRSTIYGWFTYFNRSHSSVTRRTS